MRKWPRRALLGGLAALAGSAGCGALFLHSPRFGALPELPASVPVARDGGNIIITYSPAEFPTSELIALVQQAGTIREMTVQPQNIDRLVAAMYREMDL